MYDEEHAETRSLTPQQCEAIEVLALRGPGSIADAAEAAGVSISTIYAWMKQPHFQAMLWKKRSDIFRPTAEAAEQIERSAKDLLAQMKRAGISFSVVETRISYDLSGVFAVPSSLSPPTTEQLRRAELDIVRLSNEARRAAGLHQLRASPVLMEIGRQRAQQLPDRFDHKDPHGVWLCENLASRLGYSGTSSLSENIARLPLTPSLEPGEIRRCVDLEGGRSVVSFGPPEQPGEAFAHAWLRSEGHRTNILSPAHSYIGAGVYWSSLWYGVQVFGPFRE